MMPKWRTRVILKDRRIYAQLQADAKPSVNVDYVIERSYWHARECDAPYVILALKPNESVTGAEIGLIANWNDFILRGDRG